MKRVDLKSKGCQVRLQIWTEIGGMGYSHYIRVRNDKWIVTILYFIKSSINPTLKDNMSLNPPSRLKRKMLFSLNIRTFFISIFIYFSIVIFCGSQNT